MNDYPKYNWMEDDVEKMKQSYLFGKEVLCPRDGKTVKVTKEQGENHLKNKYAETHFYLTYECSDCGRRDTKTHRKSP